MIRWVLWRLAILSGLRPEDRSTRRNAWWGIGEYGWFDTRRGWVANIGLVVGIDLFFLLAVVFEEGCEARAQPQRREILPRARMHIVAVPAKALVAQSVPS